MRLLTPEVSLPDAPPPMMVSEKNLGSRAGDGA
jgi:hypothetical protein